VSRRLLLAAAGGGSIPPWTRGTVTPDGSPATVLADTHGNRFPGIVRLDAGRVLVVYSRDNADIYGIIGTLTPSTWAVSWGSAFLIYSVASDVLLEESVEVIDGRVVIAARLFNGTINHDSFLLRSSVAPASVTSSSSWDAPISVPLAVYTGDNLITGRVHKLINGTYLVAYYGSDIATSFTGGVLLSSSLTDWSALTRVAIAPVDAVNFTEIDVEEYPDGTLVAHVRTEVPKQHYIATSTDHGATWSSLTSAYSAFGYPMFRRLTSGLQVTVYRQASTFLTYYRQSANDGATWTAEAVLDGTATISGHAADSAYATCVYSITDDRFGTFPANLYSQVFTDSSTR
jgi:hypothetical protein